MCFDKTILNLIFSVAGLILFQSISSAANDNTSYESLASELKACVLTEEDAARLKCFDSLANKFSEPEEIVKKKEKAQALPENLGGRKFEESPDAEEGSRGLVTSCQKSYDGKWFFIFENGQVWKQVDRVKRRYKGCNFNVTINKDGFGYKLRVDGDENRSIRIKRHK